MRQLPSNSSILYVGCDTELNKAYCALLRHAGYDAHSSSPGHAASAIAHGDIDALILCATVTQEESLGILKTLSARAGGIPVIRLHFGYLGSGPQPSATATIDMLQGPETLLYYLSLLLPTPKSLPVRPLQLARDSRS
ncbi:MAG TPA: hypothetical protein VN577_21180 [Terriglobales bacterium]|nr:hypothetical protein [Terriglobales bacterium]